MSCKDMRQPGRRTRTLQSRGERGPLKEIQKRVTPQIYVNSSQTLYRRDPAMVNRGPTGAGRGEGGGQGHWGRSQRDVHLCSAKAVPASLLAALGVISLTTTKGSKMSNSYSSKVVGLGFKHRSVCFQSQGSLHSDVGLYPDSGICSPREGGACHSGRRKQVSSRATSLTQPAHRAASLYCRAEESPCSLPVDR